MSVYNKPVFSLELPPSEKIDLVEAYDQWELERTAPLLGSPELFSGRVLPLQEDIARSARQVYDAAPTLEVAETEILKAVIEHHVHQGKLPEEGLDSEATLRTLVEPTETYTGLPVPGESMLTTIENFKVASKYAEVMGDHAEGVLISGSTAWGSFYAVRGEKSRKGRSDIDLLVETKDLDAMRQALLALMGAGLVNTETDPDAETFDEAERFEAFHFSHMRDEVDMFSVRSKTTGIEVSVHFITSTTMNAVVSHDETMRSKTIEGHDITYLRDFRPNVPRNTKEDKNQRNATLLEKAVEGYDIYDLRRFTDIKFATETTKALHDLHHVGYVSESPLGTTIRTKQGQSYGMGLMPFYLSMSPVILSEKDGAMQKRAQAMQTSIGRVMEGNAPKSLIREDRIPPFVCEAIKNALTLKHGQNSR